MIRAVIHSDTLAETAHVSERGPRQTRIPRRLVAGLAGFATALSVILGTPAVARADNDDVLKALAAFAAVALIAQQLNKADDKPKPKPQPKPAPVVKPRVPAVCAIDIDGTTTPTVRVYGERCLKDEGFRWALPESCARPVRIFGRADRIFPSACLAKAGFDVGPVPR